MIASPQVRGPVTLSKHDLAECRLYPNIKTPAQAAVVMAKAHSYALCPTMVAESLYFVGGKPAMSAQLVATLVKRSAKYDYRVREKTDRQCSIEFFEVVDGKRESLGIETFTMVMAQRAGLASSPTWKKFPEALLWARALTAGVRARCPDALGGGPVYTVEELSPGTPVDDEGRPVIAGEVVEHGEGPSPAHEAVRRLIEETDTDLTKLVSYYHVNAVEELSVEQLADIRSKLSTKRSS
jgi:hypothetical protein